MSDEVKVGDLIRLKSGGPKMVAVAIDTTQFDTQLSVWCEWFDEKNKPQHATFKLIAVEKAATEKPLSPPPAKRRAVRIIKA